MCPTKTFQFSLGSFKYYGIFHFWIPTSHDLPHLTDILTMCPIPMWGDFSPTWMTKMFFLYPPWNQIWNALNKSLGPMKFATQVWGSIWILGNIGNQGDFTLGTGNVICKIADVVPGFQTTQECFHPTRLRTLEEKAWKMNNEQKRNGNYFSDYLIKINFWVEDTSFYPVFHWWFLKKWPVWFDPLGNGPRSPSAALRHWRGRSSRGLHEIHPEVSLGPRSPVSAA